MFSQSVITRQTTAADRQTLWMKLPLDKLHATDSFLRPESPLEKELLRVPGFRQGLFWGEPRFGHPEGKVILHIREVLDNIDLIKDLSDTQRSQLRLITLVHDTFKYAEDRTRPRDWNKHHSLLARRFLEDYTQDPVVLDIVETHDDAYYAWLAQKHALFGQQNPHKLLPSFLSRVGYCMQLYYLFFKCDTQTGDKTQASIKWFEQTVPGIEFVPIREGSDLFLP